MLLEYWEGKKWGNYEGSPRKESGQRSLFTIVGDANKTRFLGWLGLSLAQKKFEGKEKGSGGFDFREIENRIESREHKKEKV